jgi:hypothetical protein
MTKLEINSRSVQATKTLLLAIIDEPHDFKTNDTIIEALKSQGALAKYEDQARDIVACSLNTQKTVAERLFEEGYDNLDALRKNASAAISAAIEIKKRSNKTTHEGKNKRIAELEGDIALLEQQNLMLTALVQTLKGKLANYAENGRQQLQANWQQDLKELNAKIAFTNRAGPNGGGAGNG